MHSQLYRRGSRLLRKYAQARVPAGSSKGGQFAPKGGGGGGGESGGAAAVLDYPEFKSMPPAHQQLAKTAAGHLDKAIAKAKDQQSLDKAGARAIRPLQREARASLAAGEGSNLMMAVTALQRVHARALNRFPGNHYPED